MDRFKFRVWDTGMERYIENPYIGWFAMYLHISGHDLNEWLHRVAASEVFVLEQCTGNYDRNGKLIYEGDIVKDGPTVGRVYWAGTGWAATNFLWKQKPQELEVIGNIHEQKDTK